ncbi:uncharacterized protein KQ657_004655 [Scheffersomyces spartinae]|uniref:Cleavage/polyadenylation specificity factor A subunit N-terminal domain-containing protein n=1 Tax=Scheffersomyces spartinae TaxID=45513 RepID=A0A9P7VAQ0_9ASCO|nr:uncharacterized protein KQ657_004655 [Scheffersomyces spartinae]KAG7194442.1 hypothetical protein KQ657_004655 [Scheffersomyces spartinae]
MRDCTIGKFITSSKNDLVVSYDNEIRVIDDTTLPRALDIRTLTTYKTPFGYDTDLILGISSQLTENPHLIVMNVAGEVLSLKLKSRYMVDGPKLLVDPTDSRKLVYADLTGSYEVIYMEKEMIDTLMQLHNINKLKKSRKFGSVVSTIHRMPSKRAIDIQFIWDGSLVGLFVDSIDTVLQIISAKGSQLIRGNITTFQGIKEGILVIDLTKVTLLYKSDDNDIDSWKSTTLANELPLEEGELVEHSCIITDHLTLLISNRGMTFLVQHKLDKPTGMVSETIKSLGLTTIPHKIMYLGDLTFYVQSLKSYLVIFKINDRKPYISIVKRFESANLSTDINVGTKKLTQDIYVCQGSMFSGELVRYPPYKNKLIMAGMKQEESNEQALVTRYANSQWRTQIPDDIKNTVLNIDINNDIKVLVWDCIKVGCSRWLASRVLLNFEAQTWFIDDEQDSKVTVQLDTFIMPTDAFLTADIDRKESFYLLILFMDGTLCIIRPFDSNNNYLRLSTDTGSVLKVTESSWGVYLLYNEYDLWIFKAWNGGCIERCSTGKRQRIRSIKGSKDLFNIDVQFDNDDDDDGDEGSPERYQICMGIQEYERIFSKSYYWKSIVVNDFIIVLSQDFRLLKVDNSSYHLIVVDRLSFKIIETFDFDDDKIPINIINVDPNTTIRNKVSSVPYLEEEVQLNNKFIVAFQSLPVALLYSVEGEGIKIERQQGWKYESIKKQHGKELKIFDFVQINPKEATFMAVGDFNFVMELKHNQIFYWTYYTNMSCTLPLPIVSAGLLHESRSIIASTWLGDLYSIKLPQCISDHGYIESMGNLESSKRVQQSFSSTKLYARAGVFFTCLKTQGSDTIVFGDSTGKIHVNIGSKYYTEQVCDAPIRSIGILPQDNDHTGVQFLVARMQHRSA